MMDLVPENYQGKVILNLTANGPCVEPECRDCLDIGGIVHNWLMTTEIPYLVVDLQDEKDVCPTFLVELLQLRKRVRSPILFSGVMEKARGVLESYSYVTAQTPIFVTPEEALSFLEQKNNGVFKGNDLSQVQFNEPIAATRLRQNPRTGAETVDEGAESADI